MKILRDKEFDALQQDLRILKESVTQGNDSLELYQERISELELAFEDKGWIRLTGETEKEFSRAGLKIINQLARLYWLKNPLIRRAVLTQTQYVFGQGLSINAKDPEVNKVIQNFLDDPKNRAELTEHQSRMVKESELQLFGNIFFVLFVNQLTGKVRIRTISVDEIEEIICDPDDSKTPWFYKRVYTRKNINRRTGSYKDETVTEYYRDWKYTDKDAKRIGGKGIEEAVIYHVAVNKLSDMKFGVSEVYAALDWAKAYKEFLEDWATIVKSYSRFAWKLTTKAGKGAIARAKTKLGTTLASDSGETNPPPAAGSVFAANESVKMDPIKTSGATTSASDGDKLVHMVSAATGIFFHYLTGDPSTGNLATAKAMERPMELMFRDRQQLWVSVYQEILNFVMEQSVKADKGVLKGTISEDEFGEETITMDNDADKTVSVTFPPLLEKDTSARIDAIIKAATLDGKRRSGTMEMTMIVKLMLEALGVEDIDEIIERMFPDGEPDLAEEEPTVVIQNPAGPNPINQDPSKPGVPVPMPVKKTAERQMTEAIRELRTTIMKLVEEYKPSKQ
jgi:hypothetical protein